jgi:hypothetical protein
MDKVLVFSNANGGLTIAHPIRERAEDVSESDFLEGIAEEVVPNGVPYTVLNAADVPDERLFREAWRLHNGTIVVELSAAKEVAKTFIRSVRVTVMNRLDVEYMRALESDLKGAAQRVTAEKSRWRDMPSLADGAESVQDLKQIMSTVESEAK